MTRDMAPAIRVQLVEIADVVRLQWLDDNIPTIPGVDSPQVREIDPQAIERFETEFVELHDAAVALIDAILLAERNPPTTRPMRQR